MGSVIDFLDQIFVKLRKFFVEIPQVSNGFLTPSAGVSGRTFVL